MVGAEPGRIYEKCRIMITFSLLLLLVGLEGLVGESEEGGVGEGEGELELSLSLLPVL